MKTLKGKVAAITGAGSGIGRALAQGLAARGCHLALSDINTATLAETAALLSSAGVRVTTQPLDVAKREAVHAWADATAAAHGKVNLIFNNAGVALGSTVERTDYADFEWLMNINFWGVVHGTKAFLPHLRRSGEEGHIVNISSIFGLVASPGNGVYNAAKFAVRGYTEALRMELDLQQEETPGPRISALCVHPGGIKTNIVKSARFHKESMEALHISDEAKARTRFEAQFRTTPEDAAATILDAVERDARRVLIGGDARALDLLVRLLPSAYQPLLRGLAKRQIVK